MMKENDRLTSVHGQIENAQRRDVKYDLEERLLDLEALIGECNELISIFVKSIKTARNNMGTAKE